MAKGLSCPEGVGLDSSGGLYVVENPVGDECRGTNLTKAARLTRAQLSALCLAPQANLLSARPLCPAPVGRYSNLPLWGWRAGVDLQSGAQTAVAPLLSPHGMAVNCGSKCFAYVCEWGAHQVTRVDLASGEKVGVGAISSPSGCAVDAAAGYAYAVQQVRPPPSCPSLAAV